MKTNSDVPVFTAQIDVCPSMTAVYQALQIAAQGDVSYGGTELSAIMDFASSVTASQYCVNIVVQAVRTWSTSVIQAEFNQVYTDASAFYRVYGDSYVHSVKKAAGYIAAFTLICSSWAQWQQVVIAISTAMNGKGFKANANLLAVLDSIKTQQQASLSFRQHLLGIKKQMPSTGDGCIAFATELSCDELIEGSVLKWSTRPFYQHINSPEPVKFQTIWTNCNNFITRYGESYIKEHIITSKAKSVRSLYHFYKQDQSLRGLNDMRNQLNNYLGSLDKFANELNNNPDGNDGHKAPAVLTDLLKAPIAVYYLDTGDANGNQHATVTSDINDSDIALGINIVSLAFNTGPRYINHMRITYGFQDSGIKQLSFVKGDGGRSDAQPNFPPTLFGTDHPITSYKMECTWNKGMRTNLIGKMLIWSDGQGLLTAGLPDDGAWTSQYYTPSSGFLVGWACAYGDCLDKVAPQYAMFMTPLWEDFNLP